MTATLSQEDIKVFNVHNKFGFLNVSDDSEDEVKPRKNIKKNNMNANCKKKQQQQQQHVPHKPTSNVVGLSSTPSSNIINPASANQGLSKSAKKRLRKKKKAEEAVEKVEEEQIVETPKPSLSPDEQFKLQLEHVIKISAEEAVVEEAKNDNAEEAEVVEAEEVEEDLFLPVIEGIKDVVKRINKDDEIRIIDIPLDNSQMLRKRAIQLQDINTEFKTQLNGLLRVGYKYKKRYQKEKAKNADLTRMLNKCKGDGKTVDLLKQIIENEDTIASVTKQVEELSEELERERTRSHALQGDRKISKKVSFSDDK